MYYFFKCALILLKIIWETSVSVKLYVYENTKILEFSSSVEIGEETFPAAEFYNDGRPAVNQLYSGTAILF